MKKEDCERTVPAAEFKTHRRTIPLANGAAAGEHGLTMTTPRLLPLALACAAFGLDVSVAGAATNAKRTPRDITSAPPVNATVQRDIPYATVDGVTLTLDLYSPKANGAAPRPLVVYVHGGGWRGGAKTTGSYIVDVTADLVSRGYVMAAIDYRLAPAAKWPAFIYDVKTAIRFLRAHAAEYRLDPHRIGAWGGSAGGHLVSLLGTADASAGLEDAAGAPKTSSRVQAVVDLFGPADLVRMDRGGDGGARRADAFGTEPDVLRRASPITYVSKDDPPFLILQGDADRLVPVEQSRHFYEALRAAGVPATLIIVKGGAHGLNNPGIAPTKPELVKTIGDFFDRHLRRSTSP